MVFIYEMYAFDLCQKVEIAARSGRIVGFRGLALWLKQLKAIRN
jgi:hypothetical protein